MSTQNILLNYTIKNISDNNKFFNVIISIKCLCSYGKKHISKNKDNNKLLSFVTSIKYLHNHGNKYISKYNNDNNLKIKVATTFFATFIKYLIKYKIAHTVIKNNFSKKI